MSLYPLLPLITATRSVASLSCNEASCTEACVLTHADRCDHVEVSPPGLTQESIVHCWDKGTHDQHSNAGIIEAPHHLSNVPLTAS